MGEREPSRLAGHLHQQPRPHRHVEDVEDVGRREPDDVGDEIVVELRTRQRTRGQHAPGAGPERPHAARHGVDGGAVERLVRTGAEDLLDEERVATRAGAQRGRVAHGRASRGRHRGHPVLVEPLQRDHLHRERAAKRAQRVREAVAPVRLGLTEGRQQQTRRAARARGEVRDEPHRGSLGPVQVVQHEQGGHRPRRVVQRRADTVEQPRARPVRDPGELRDRCVGRQAGDDRLVRHERLLLGPPVEDDGALRVHLRGQLGDEARLADPRLARHEDRGAALPAGARPERPEQRELALATDERPAPPGGDDVRGQRRCGGRRRVGAQLGREGARRPRRRDPELAPQALAQPLVRRQRGASVPREGVAAHELAVPRPRRAGRAPRGAARIRPRRPGLPRGRPASRARRRHGRDARRGRSAPTRRRTPSSSSPRHRPSARSGSVSRQRSNSATSTHAPRQPDLLPIGHEDRCGVRPERGAQRGERAAQAHARAVLAHVGPQAPGHPGPRVDARMDGEPAEQEPRGTPGGELQIHPVALDLQTAEHAHAQHGANPTSAAVSRHEPVTDRSRCTGTIAGNHDPGGPRWRPRRPHSTRPGSARSWSAHSATPPGSWRRRSPRWATGSGSSRPWTGTARARAPSSPSTPASIRGTRWSGCAACGPAATWTPSRRPLRAGARARAGPRRRGRPVLPRRRLRGHARLPATARSPHGGVPLRRRRAAVRLPGGDLGGHEPLRPRPCYDNAARAALGARGRRAARAPGAGRAVGRRRLRRGAGRDPPRSGVPLVVVRRLRQLRGPARAGPPRRRTRPASATACASSSSTPRPGCPERFDVVSDLRRRARRGRPGRAAAPRSVRRSRRTGSCWCSRCAAPTTRPRTSARSRRSCTASASCTA